MDRAAPTLKQFAFLLEFFALDTVPTLLLTEVNVAVVPYPLKKLVDNGVVARTGGAAKAIVVDMQLLPQGLKTSGNLIAVGLGTETRCWAVRSIFWPCSSVPVMNRT